MTGKLSVCCSCQVKDTAQAIAHLGGRNFAVLVFVEGIKDGITTQQEQTASW